MESERNTVTRCGWQVWFRSRLHHFAQRSTRARAGESLTETTAAGMPSFMVLSAIRRNHSTIQMDEQQPYVTQLVRQFYGPKNGLEFASANLLEFSFLWSSSARSRAVARDPRALPHALARNRARSTFVVAWFLIFPRAIRAPFTPFGRRSAQIF